MALLSRSNFRSKLKKCSSLIKRKFQKHRVDSSFMSRQRDEKGRFIKNPLKIEVTGPSFPKGFISIVGTFKMAEEETSKGPTVEQRREYERMLEVENKRRQERREEERQHERDEERRHEREEERRHERD